MLTRTWLRLLAFWGLDQSTPLPGPRKWRVREVDHLLDQTAERLGFERSDDGPATCLRGRRRELEVAVTVRRIPWGDEVRFQQEVRVLSPKPLTPTPLEFETRTRRSPSGVRTRDPAFDRDMVAHGDEAICLALLSSSARATIVGNAGRWRVLAEGELSWTAHRAPNFLFTSTERVIELVETWRALENDLVRGLSQRARHDPQPEVRRRAFAVLWSRFREDPRSLETARAAMTDRMPQLRMEAALAVGEAGRGTLLDILCARSTPRSLRLVVAGHLPTADPEVVMRLEALAESPDLRSRLMAVELLGRLGGPETVGYLEPLTHRFGAGTKLRRAAKEARTRVLARYANLEAGQLAVIEEADEAGALSEVGAET